MPADLLAGIHHRAPPMRERRPTILVFDSGLGGLTVLSELEARCPAAQFVYAGDDAAFPYGDLTEPALVRRILLVMERLIARCEPDLVVIACNTASTIVLPHLRARFALPFVGTVPPIKPAALQSQSRLFSVLATPGTVARDYTHDLIETYAAGCAVTLVGSTRLAGYAEREMSGQPVTDDELRAELAPCFVRDGAAATDVVVLACTHYPLLLARLRRLAPWPVTWIDPAPAIARRVADLIGPRAPSRLLPPDETSAVFTSGTCLTPALQAALERRGLGGIDVEPMPLAAL
jgi:glutamate racemase